MARVSGREREKQGREGEEKGFAVEKEWGTADVFLGHRNGDYFYP
jgi:hypothetical protein